MGFVKGTDGIARTVRNPLEGSIGDITLNDVGVATLTASGNVNGGNVISTALVRGVTVQATGNLTGGNANISNGVFATTGGFGGNVSVGNLSTGGRVFATGNVTAGNISVGGAANISNVTVNSYTFVPQLWFKGTLSTDQSLTTSNDTIILYNSNSDPLIWGTTAGSNGRIVPNKAGWYEVVSRAQFSAIAGNVNAQINHQISVNGVQQAISQVPNSSVVGAGVCVVATAMVNLNGTTDYITTSCYTTVAGQTCVGSNSTLLLIKWVST
jgi:hypothetical protein